MGSLLSRLVIALALVAAQHVALAHQVWHGAGKLDKGTQNSPLCDQHAALGTVLGALSGFHTPTLLAGAAPLHFAVAHSPAGDLPALHPASRGPPCVP